MEMQEVLHQILEKVTNLESGQRTLEEGQQSMELRLQNLESGQQKFESALQKLEANQQKMQRDIDRISVHVKNTDNTIRYIFDDIYRLEKRIESK
jgi:peptidoglycan hydrolase CwlO-like protein